MSSLDAGDGAGFVGDPGEATATDLQAGTLSPADRDRFLRQFGAVPGADPALIARINAEWSDEDILEVIGSGLG